MSQLGENLSRYLHLEPVTAKSVDELNAKLALIRLPFSIISMYFDSKEQNHVVWINLSRKLTKRQRGLINGSTRRI